MRDEPRRSFDSHRSQGPLSGQKHGREVTLVPPSAPAGPRLHVDRALPPRRLTPAAPRSERPAAEQGQAAGDRDDDEEEDRSGKRRKV